MRSLVLLACLCGCVLSSGVPVCQRCMCSSVWPLQMQCYHCEESLLDNDCSSPRFIANCTANIQNACQQEVIHGRDGVITYRKQCATYSTCLIAETGYQSFCNPGHRGSICISCCDTPLCNGPRPPRANPAPPTHAPLLGPTLLMLLATLSGTLHPLLLL
ncbi:ly6/PLAUR domain-containing protein 1-like [Engraulis encrasicolus]|uniref:ly6/PLAUR domain-containing protein 1-like n=1 Tax=Engraulis encrasicolus TaxID=184585 RepID=UPI002FD634F7